MCGPPFEEILNADGFSKLLLLKMDFREFDLFITDLPKGPAMILLTSHPRISLAIKWYTYNRVPLHSNTTLKSLMKALPFRAVLYFSIVHTGDKEGVSVPGTFSEHSNKNVEPRCRHQQRKSQSRRSFFLSN